MIRLSQFKLAWGTGHCADPTIFFLAVQCCLVYKIFDTIFNAAHQRRIRDSFYLYVMDSSTGECVMMDNTEPNHLLFEVPILDGVGIEVLHNASADKHVHALRNPVWASRGLLKEPSINIVVKIFRKKMIDFISSVKQWNPTTMPRTLLSFMGDDASHLMDFGVLDVAANLFTPSTYRRDACAVCGVDTCMQMCSKCRKVCYCGSECQARHWRFHRTECSIMNATDIEILDAMFEL